jgi:hypothetical protein
MLLLKFLKRGRRRVQHTAQLSHPLLRFGDPLLSLGCSPLGFRDLLFQLHRLLESGD